MSRPDPKHHHSELIARPAQTPQALRVALARIQPSRLGEMQETMDRAFSDAVGQKSLTPIRAWMTMWAQSIEIARRPELASRYDHAQGVLAAYDRREHDDEEAVNQALAETASVLDEALRAVSA